MIQVFYSARNVKKNSMAVFGVSAAPSAFLHSSLINAITATGIPNLTVVIHFLAVFLRWF